MIRLLLAGLMVLMGGSANAAERLTTDQTRPYAKKCAQSISDLQGSYSFYNGMIMDDNTHSYSKGDKARSAKKKTGDAEQFFATILEQEFKDISGNQKYRIWSCEFTINDGIQVVRFNPGCQSMNKHISFVSKNEASHNNYEEYFFYRDQYIIFSSDCF